MRTDRLGIGGAPITARARAAIAARAGSRSASQLVSAIAATAMRTSARPSHPDEV